MRTLIELDKTVLLNYNLWQMKNESNWNITSYLNQFYDVNAALAFSKLFFPDFIEKENCVILSFRYDEKIFQQWYEEFDGHVSSVEKYCNLYDVSDYFHINISNYDTDELYERAINELAKALKKSWEANCSLLFPNRSFLANVYEEFGVTKITLHTI